MALLIRRLKQRVAPNSILQCIATSASLTGSVRNDPRGEAMEFASNLFDAPFEYIDGDLSDRISSSQCAKNICRHRTGGSATSTVGVARGTVNDAQLVYPRGLDWLKPSPRAVDARTQGCARAGPVDVRELREQIWPSDDRRPKSWTPWLSLVAVFTTRRDSLCCRRVTTCSCVRPKAPSSASMTDGPRIFLSRHEVDPDTGRAVFEFGTCTRCGAVHLAGELTRHDGKEYFVPAKKADGRSTGSSLRTTRRCGH